MPSINTLIEDLGTDYPMPNTIQKQRVVMLDMTHEGLLFGSLDGKPMKNGVGVQGELTCPGDNPDRLWIGIVFWHQINTAVPMMDICNATHPVGLVPAYDPSLDGALSYTPTGNILSREGERARRRIRMLPVFGWQHCRDLDNVYRIRFCFDQETGRYFIKEKGYMTYEAG